MASKDKTERRAAERAERLAQLQKQEKAEKRRRTIMVGGVAGIAIVLIVATIALLTVFGDDSGANDDLDVAAAVEPSDYGVVIGAEDAPHSIVIYEDFICPACGALEAATGDELAQLAADGEVRVDYRPFTLLSRFGPYSADAVTAFGAVKETAGDEVAKEFHDLLYADQPAEDADSFPDTDWFVDKAVQAGADETAVRTAIEGADTAFEQGATSAAGEVGVNGTPTVILDGAQFLPDSSWSELLDAVRE